MFENPWIPETYKAGLTPRQAEFLTFEGREAMYGGAAGGGKSVALLMAALQYANQPGYHALILRRNYAQLAKAESILNLSKEWLSGKVPWNGDTYTWTFPSGATLAFGHMQNEDDRYNYQGAAYRYVGYDELTQFHESTYTYLFSRQRRDATSDIPLRMRSATNPGGMGHAWVYKRFIDPATRRAEAKFFPALLSDNPNLDQEAYIESLNELDAVTRGQLLQGDWSAVEGGRFKRDWFRWYRRDETPDWIKGGKWRFNPSSQPIFTVVDPAASEKTTADYTVVGTFTVSPNAELVWLDCERFQKDIPDIVPEIMRVVRRWRPQFVAVEAVASNRAVLQLLSRETNPMVPVRSVNPRGLDKLTRATPAMVLAEQGRLYLPEDNSRFPVDDVVGELVRFSGNARQDGHDDIVDVLSYACETLPNVTPKLNAAPTAYVPQGPLDSRTVSASRIPHRAVRR